ncbi:MAG TPA: hypothetical protein PK530_16455, partial [Anaerolineales bacterium]|nr:hypothetical protein [Anaerolineales bacterium]
PSPIATPGAIYNPLIHVEIPEGLRLADWQFDQQYMLLYRETVWFCEWCFGRMPLAKISLYDWQADKIIDIKTSNPEEEFGGPPVQGQDGMIAFVTQRSDRGKIVVIDTKNKTLQTVGEGDYLAFSPGSSKIAYWIKGNLYELDLKTLEKKRLYLIPGFNWHGGDRVNDLSWSPDGKKLTFIFSTEKEGGGGGFQDEVIVFDLVTQNFDVITINSPSIYFPVWSPDSRLIAYIESPLGKTNDININIMDTAQKCLAGTVNLTIGLLDRLEWSPDGSVLTFSGVDPGYLFFVDIEKVFGAPYDKLTCIQ